MKGEHYVDFILSEVNKREGEPSFWSECSGSEAVVVSEGEEGIIRINGLPLDHQESSSHAWS